MESALLAVQNDVDAIGATRGVKADMVETKLEVGLSQLEAWNSNLSNQEQ